MSAAGSHGMKIFLDKVPTRQSDMKDWEILLSESQERMLIVVKKGNENIVNEIFKKWDLSCEKIGEVIEGDYVEYYMHDLLVAKVPYDSLVLGGGAPIYEREYTEPEYFKSFKNFNIDSIKLPSDLVRVARFMCENPNISSKRWVFEQYDSMVGTVNMSTNIKSDAAIVNLKGSKRALAMTVDCNSRFVNSNPQEGCSMAVAEAARNIVCSGGVPSAITNCLNFGNPYNPEVYWQFVNSIKGMKLACEKFKTPVTGGNVSFYNQTSDDNIEIPVFPTPTIGMLGIVEDKSHITSLSFQNEKDLIFLIGTSKNNISCSEYLTSFHNIKESSTPEFCLDTEFKLQEAIKNLIRKNLIKSAHDVSDGGLFICLIESCIDKKFGFQINGEESIRDDAFLFGESPSRVIVSVSKSKENNFVKHLESERVDFRLIGSVTSGEISFNDISFGDIKDYKNLYENSLSDKMNT